LYESRRGIAPTRGLSSPSTTAKKLEHEHHEGDDQKNVNEASSDAAQETEQPQDE
jgi:hypothetical protein